VTPPSEFYYGRWIDVDLTHQTLTAYQGDQVARTTLVSTGLAGTPTPVGLFHVQTRMRYDDMRGPGYYLPDVPYVMYFYKGYGIHGTYWHANFGHPMSHGCINLPTEEAAWLYYWVGVGTPVNIHQ
jgi:lipoprotein-anchoring transpeptidase ErfK/SrfK